MALTETQKKWLTGGSVGAATLFVGYLLFRDRPTYAGAAGPAGHSHGGH